MLDVQKAFDSVDHKMLCEKIRLAGIEPDWFISYLENRKQTIYVNETFSSLQTIKCGVPQGSILGPWCYIMFCNDMPSCVDCTMVIYADDTILLASGKDPNEVVTKLNGEIKKCYEWLTDNKLSMHQGKTEALIISSKRKQLKTKDITFNIDNHIITPSTEVKYLGLKLNNTLSGDEIVNNIIGKSTSRLKLLYRHKDLFNKKTRKLLTKSLILCHYDYAIAAWYMGLTSKNKKRLQVAQNKVARFVLELNNRAHIGQNELDRVGVLRVEDRARQIILHHMYDIYHNDAPAYLCRTFHCNRTRYSTRSSNNAFTVPRTKGCAQNNFNVIGSKEWNNLPSNIKMSQSKDSYKQAVRAYLKAQAHQRETNEFIYY